MADVKIKIDRGIELNRKRVNSIEVDVWFLVKNETIPAHRLIVALHSDYLKALTSPSSSFMERDTNVFPLLGISAHSFKQILEYMYTGSITISEDNVFDLFESMHFLQIKAGDPLLNKCVKWMVQKLESCEKLNASLLVKMWNICEMFNDKELKKAVMNFVDCHLEELIQDNLLEFLGFDEVQEILTRPKLCVWSHKFVCDSILKWILQKQSPAELIDVDELNMLAQLISTLRKTFSNMSDLYFDDPTFNDLIPKSSLSNSHRLKEVTDGCMDCSFIIPWSRDEKDICGLELYLEERKEQQVFMTWNMKDKKCQEIKSMQNSRSFYQHYGPIHIKNGCLVNCDSLLFYLGGTKMNTSSSKRNRDNGSISNEAFVFDMVDLCWLRMTNRLPKAIIRFGTLFISPHLYLIGGLTYEPDGNSRMHTIDSRKYFISRSIFRIHVDDWFSSAQKWQHVGNIPEERIDFSVGNIDNNKICLVTSQGVDIFDITKKTWQTIAQPTSHLKTIGHGKPSIAIIGTILYVINSKSDAIGSNSIWSIDLADQRSPAWQPLLPSLDLRFDPIQAFSHNGALFILGHQTSLRNFVYKFDPVNKEWTKQLESFGGHFVNGAGILLRRQRVKRAFFQGY